MALLSMAGSSAPVAHEPGVTNRVLNAAHQAGDGLTLAESVRHR